MYILPKRTLSSNVDIGNAELVCLFRSESSDFHACVGYIVVCGARPLPVAVNFASLDNVALLGKRVFANVFEQNPTIIGVPPSFNGRVHCIVIESSRISSG